jgi:hypothetical protein
MAAGLLTEAFSRRSPIVLDLAISGVLTALLSADPLHEQVPDRLT